MNQALKMLRGNARPKKQKYISPDHYKNQYRWFYWYGKIIKRKVYWELFDGYYVIWERIKLSVVIEYSFESRETCLKAQKKRIKEGIKQAKENIIFNTKKLANYKKELGELK